jgi:hypothetical protein
LVNNDGDSALDCLVPQRQFNAFASGKSPARQLPFLSKGGKKRLAEIAMRLKKARNGIAHPYRVERDGTDRPMTLGQVLSLEAVTAETRLLAEDRMKCARVRFPLFEPREVRR